MEPYHMDGRMYFGAQNYESTSQPPQYMTPGNTINTMNGPVLNIPIPPNNQNHSMYNPPNNQLLYTPQNNQPRYPQNNNQPQYQPPCNQPLYPTPNNQPLYPHPSNPPIYTLPNNRAQYSPPPVPSPPLDDINMVSTNLATQDQQSNQSNAQRNPNKIPKVGQTVSASSHGKYEDMNLLNLQKRYGEFDEEQVKVRRKRREIEKALNDMTRNNHGKNIEMDPSFRQKKDEQKKCDVALASIQSEMRTIQDKLLTKYAYKIQPKQQAKPPAPLAPPSRRAKMSTTASSSASRDRTELKPPKPIKDSLKQISLDLKDPRPWCQTCDDHFDSIKEFCDHLHTRDHIRAMKKSTPWRTTRDLLDKRKTYDIYKSMCAKLSNELKMSFSLKDLDYALNPLMDDKAKKLKQNTLKREQGSFSDTDRLFEPKGYDFLIPISGFFCPLCNRALCDLQHVQQHLRSYEHNNAHAKSVALNPQHEIQFQTQRERSYAKQFPSESIKESNSTKQKEPSSNVTPSSSNALPSDADAASGDNTVERPPPLVQYKKATSKIVDEHETIADKFVRKDRSDRAYPLADANERQPAPIGVRKRISNAVPEIVPLGNCQPSALKRLKTATITRTKALRSTTSESTGSDRSPEPEEDIDKNIHLNAGHPDSPFPDLSLRITGNMNVSLLKDKRLAGPCRVVMDKLDICELQDTMLDEAKLWAVAHRMMAKKESKQISNDILAKDTVRPTYFTASGANVPVDVDQNEDERDEKPKICSTSDDEKSDIKSDTTDNRNSVKKKSSFKEIVHDDLDSEMFDTRSETDDRLGFELKDLEKFFTE